MTNSGPVRDNAAHVDAAQAEAPLLKLEEFLPHRLNVLSSLVSQALTYVYARRGIGIPEWRVLVTLGEYGVMTGKAVGAHTHMHKTKVSRAVAQLEQRKLLTRRANAIGVRGSSGSGGHVKLYTYFRSSAAYRVRIALNLKGLSGEMIPIHLQKEGGLNKKPQYRAINPQMRVPALALDSGEVLTQSLAIIEYLDEMHPQPPLLPPDPIGRAR